MFARLLEMLLYLVIDVLRVGGGVDGQKLVALEIPGGFVGVPVLLGDCNITLDDIDDVFVTNLKRKFTYGSSCYH